jgi:hypothetical protein
MTTEWLDNAPRFSGLNVVPLTIEYEDKPYPAVAFQFLRASATDNEQTEMIPLVLLSNGDIGLRALQRHLDKAITEALREVKAKRIVKSPLLLLKDDVE